MAEQGEQGSSGGSRWCQPRVQCSPYTPIVQGRFKLKTERKVWGPGQRYETRLKTKLPCWLDRDQGWDLECGSKPKGEEGLNSAEASQSLPLPHALSWPSAQSTKDPAEVNALTALARDQFSKGRLSKTCEPYFNKLKPFVKLIYYPNLLRNLETF